MSLQTKLFLTTTAAIVILVGAPEWLTYQHTAAFFNRHDTVMQHGETPEVIRTLRTEKNSFLVRLAIVHVFNGALTDAL